MAEPHPSPPPYPAAPPSFADELRRLREARGLNRKALAGLAGLDPSTMTRLEKGERGPSREVVDRLATALQATRGQQHAMLRASGFLTEEAAELLDEPTVARLAALLARPDLAPPHRGLLLRQVQLALDLATALGYDTPPRFADG